MIRLSCWIGVMGCVISGKALANDADQTIAPAAKISPMKRFVKADVDESGGFKCEKFANAAPKLARYFQVAEGDDDGEASGEEMMVAWRKYKDRLVAHLVDGTAATSPKRQSTPPSGPGPGIC